MPKHSDPDKLTKNQKATITFYDSGDGNADVQVELPDDLDENNLRPFERACVFTVNMMQDSGRVGEGEGDDMPRLDYNMAKKMFGNGS